MDSRSHSHSPPTSLLQPESVQYSQVIFTRMGQSYVPGTDVQCYFTYSSTFQPGKKDWVGIFKVSWKTTREYFTWVAAACDEEDLEKHVTFKAYYLPKENDDYYQFCYVDQNGEVRGVSVPFKFCRLMEEAEYSDILMVTTEEEALLITEEKKKAEERIALLEGKVTELEKCNCALKDDLSLLRNSEMSLRDRLLDSTKRNDEIEQQNRELLRQLEEERNRNKALVLDVKSAKEEKKNTEDGFKFLKLEFNQLKEEYTELQTKFSTMEISLKVLSEEKYDAQEEIRKLSSTVDCQEKEMAEIRKHNKEEYVNLLEQMKKIRLTAELKETEVDELTEQHIRDNKEIDHLNALLSGKSSSSLYSGLFYSNPYSGKRPDSSDSEEQYHDVSEGNSLQEERRITNMKCPECGTEFEELQVYHDHMMCHDLESMPIS